MKAKTMDKRGGSWPVAFLRTQVRRLGSLWEKKRWYKHLYIISRERRQTAKEVREQRLSTEPDSGWNVIERHRIGTVKWPLPTPGGCCFLLGPSVHIRHMYQGEYLGEARLVSSSVRLTDTTQVFGLTEELRYTVLFSIFNPSDCHFYIFI